MDTQKPNIIVAGNGMVGYKFCEKAVELGLNKKYNIIAIGEEPRVAYDRVHLSEFFAGKSAADLELAPNNWYKENEVHLLVNDPVTEICRDTKEVKTQNGSKIPYEKLVLATGSSCFIPPVPGIEAQGIFPYRTIDDLEDIKKWAAKAEKGAVIGGGLLGLEAAKALKDLGLKASVVEFAPRLMPRQLDEKGAELLKEKIEELGIDVLVNKHTKQIHAKDSVSYMEFADDSVLETDMVLVSAGIRPRDELGKKSGLEIGERGGVVVNDQLQTSDPDIYAIGEVALHEKMIYGLVAPGYDMAAAVAENLSGGDKIFSGFDMSTKLKLIGVDVASFGDALGTTEGSRPIVYENKAKGIYKRINISADGQYLLGGILVGDADDYNMMLQTVNNKMILPPDPEDVVLGSRGGEEEGGSGVMNLPDNALICSCNNVSKSDICNAIEYNDIDDMEPLKECTKAGTGCGGCLPMVKDLMSATLKEAGKEVNKNICAHFPYSRQELFGIIKSKKIQSYDELLEEYGDGSGCEICKPAVASLMASIWNDQILNQATIQDTNDRFLANIQKGGTYSIVPRVAGGEITADKLIVLGQVAKKYDLYVKVTGGQRIDLFGAELNQLPDIWSELIEAGFESGHAYGKALRTVKSCVGSSWCRYGVQDSVSFAIEVEDRYKGLRAPHKLKSAVSGCVRECAEAQSKDFGILATEKGWNLYVGGNGGAKPQHAKLLAADIDKETCIKYIDRFLMFYIRTAEPLTRTATWLNKLEGGMEYLKDVIINDSLGIAEELEKDMEHHVATYKCEWKDAIEDETKRKRFRHFANSDDSDPSIEFKEVRGQKVPAGWK